MVARHAICRLVVPCATLTHGAPGLALCLALVAAAPAAENVGAVWLPVQSAGRLQATPPVSKSSSIEFALRAETADDMLPYAGTVRSASDRFDQPTSSEAVSQAQYISPGEPPELPPATGGDGQQPRAICDAAREKPPGQLTIDIQTPAGEVPRDHAAECWPEIAGPTGANPLVRCWSQQCYRWQATCLACQPLYFEDINLERHGYGLGDLCQPFVSGAHFFGTVPCLPYLIAVNPPCECIYALGHYRPGSCPPWQHHWPPASAVGAFSEAGVITGLIFLIP